MEQKKMIAIIVAAIAIIALIAAAVLLTSGNGSKGGEDTGDVSVTGITLNKTTVTLKPGASETITATVLPSNATNKNVTWSTSAPGVATVSGGRIIAVADGTATITAKTADGGLTANCIVTVKSDAPPVPTVSNLDDAVLKVLGNVNGDVKIDADDVKLIQGLIAAKAKVSDENKIADANNDGAIDQKDVDVVNKIIARQSTPIWHINYFDQDSNGSMDEILEKTEFPINSFIMTGSSNSFMLLWMLGVKEEVKGACYSSTVDTYFKNYYLDTSKVEKIGTSSTTLPFENGKVGTSNIIAEKNVTAVFTDWNKTYITNWQSYENSGIDVVRVSAAAVETDVFAHGALLCGLLFGKVDRSIELVNFYNEAYSQIEDKLAGVPEAQKPGFIASSMTGYVSVGDSDYNKVGTMAAGRYALEGYQSTTSSVKIIDNPQFYNPLLYNFDYILHLRTGNYYADEVNVDKVWNDYTSAFGDWEKGTAGQYIICGGMPVPMRVAYAASVMHPDLVSVDWANGLHQQLVDKFFNGDKLDISAMSFIIHKGAVSVEDSEMKVFGNADGNTTIDAADLAIIKSLVSAGAAVDDTNRMADANNDGVFSQADIDLVNSIVKGDEVDVTFVDQLNRTVTVGYPLDNIVALRSDVCAFMAIGGFEDYVAGWSGSNQKNIYAGLDAAGAEHIGTGAVMSDALWKSIVDLDAKLYTQGGVGAVVVDRLADLKEYIAALDALGMPYFGLRVTDPELNIPATSLLGFLCGPEMQARAQAYVEDCEEAMAYLDKQLSTLSDSQRVHFISACMYKCVSGDTSQYSKIGKIAGGICETKVAGDSSPSLETKEAITEYDNLITQILNFSTAGFDNEDLYAKWDNAGVQYMEASKWYEGMVFINNSLPVTARVLYAANVMYPELITMDYADAFLQKIVDEHMSFLDGTQADGDFDVKEDMACVVTYQQHQDHKASS